MKRNLLLLATVAAIGAAAIAVGAGHSSLAVACDKNATQSASAIPSCCAQKGATTEASASDVHGATMTAGNDENCPWCTPGMCRTAAAAAAAGCPAFAASNGCEAHTAAMKGTCEAHASAMTAGAGCPAHTAAMKGTCEAHGSAMTAGAGCPAHTAAMAASSGGRCAGKAAAAGSPACNKSAAMKAAAGSPCCASKTAGAAGARCEKSLQSASLQGVVDEIPYRESKRLVLAGTYACGHCSLHLTEACAPMFKTADGKVYPLMKDNRSADLRKAGATNGVQLSAQVRNINGVKYLEVKSFKTL